MLINNFYMNYCFVTHNHNNYYYYHKNDDDNFVDDDDIDDYGSLYNDSNHG